MKTIYFVRHGQSQANVDKVFAGSRLDSPLTELGFQQAVVTAAKLRQTPIDIIVSSPLKRATQTAERIAHEVNYAGKIQLQPLLAERDFGSATGKSWDDQKLGERIDEGLVEGAETLDQLAERVRQLLAWIKTLPEERILIVGHGSTETMLYLIYKGLPQSDYVKSQDLKNAEIREYLLD